MQYAPAAHWDHVFRTLRQASENLDWGEQWVSAFAPILHTREEVAAGQFATPQAYLQHYGIVDLIAAQTVSQRERLPEGARLHVGEAQAIQLARELALPLLIEETVGRRVAQGLGISISGIAGQILKAFRQGLLTAQEARKKLLELFQAGRINRQIYEALLAVIS